MCAPAPVCLELSQMSMIPALRSSCMCMQRIAVALTFDLPTYAAFMHSKTQENADTNIACAGMFSCHSARVGLMMRRHKAESESVQFDTCFIIPHYATIAKCHVNASMNFNLP